MIVLINRMAEASGNMPSWLDTPPISFTAVATSDTLLLYKAAFSAVALAFAGMAIPMYDFVLHRAPNAVRCSVHAAFVCAFLAFTGLWVQAVCPLQLDLLQHLNRMGGAEQAPAPPALQVQTIVHQVGAISFFVLSFVHGGFILHVYRYGCSSGIHSPHGSHPAPPSFPSQSTGWNAPLGWCMAYVAQSRLSLCQCRPDGAVGAAAPWLWSRCVAPPSECPSLPPAHCVLLLTCTETPGQDRVNLGGLIQWVAVGTVVAMWATYTIDFHAIARAARPKRA